MLRSSIRRHAAAAANRATLPQLLRLSLPGSLAAWEAAGFARNGDADDYSLSIGGVNVGVCSSRSSWGWRDGPRTRGWPGSPNEAEPPHWAGLKGEGFTESVIDGVHTAIDDLDDMEYEEHIASLASAATAHPNGAVGIYSVCVTTPHFDATIQAFTTAGLDLRRLRGDNDPASPLSRGLSMAFFKFGTPGRNVILELIGPGKSEMATEASVTAERVGFAVGDESTIAGMVVEVPSIAPLATVIGASHITKERAAAQGHGRRIATLKHEAIGLPLPIAFITPSEGRNDSTGRF